ncbi:MAG: nucleotidyltransferase family protein [Phycisphaerae bacterium]
MDAVILAGGRGTRLNSVVMDVPKPMADIGGRPFLQYGLDHLLSQGIERLILAVGYKYEAVRGYFGKAYQGVPIVYSIENEPLGTGGALRQALSLAEGKDVLAINGDSLFKIPLKPLWHFHEQKRAVLTVALKRMSDCGRYGSVRVDGEGRIHSFEEKRAGASGAINGGVYILDRGFLSNLNLPERFSFEQDVLEQGCSQFRFFAMELTDYFIDIGVPEDYARATDELSM